MKARLIVQEGPSSGLSYSLDPFQQPVLSVGRSSQCDIVLKDPRVSGSRGERGRELGSTGVSVESERDQTVDDLGKRDAARLPHPRKQADRGEARDGVDFVHQDLLALAFHEEVHPRHAVALEYLVSASGQQTHVALAFAW